MATYYVATYGSNSNNGTSPATPWLTLGFALGAASGTNPGLTAGDTLWIAPGTYRGSVTSTTLTGTSGNTIKIYGDPAFTRAWTAGTAGYVRITNFVTDTTTPSASQTIKITGDYIDVQDLYIDGQSSAFSTTDGGVLFIKGGNISLNRCVVTSSYNTTNQAFVWICPAGKTTLNVTKCSFFSPYCIVPYLETQGTTPYNLGASITDCVLWTNNSGIYALNQTAAQGTGLSLYNNTIISTNNGVNIENYNVASAASNIFRNNLIMSTSVGFRSAAGTLAVTQNNNIVIAPSTYQNVTPTTNTISANSMLDFGASRIQGYGALPWYAPITNALAIGAGTTTGAPLVDLYNNTWISNPTIGAIESKSESDNGQYLPTERNTSSLSILPGATSQSIEIYLGATGLTYNTSGLQAYYIRNRSTTTAISLVSQTASGSWVSGGFAEISSSNAPGLYRLDIPNAALASGTDEVTIVVKGASGTNGAVVTINLRKLQLDPNQTIGTTTVGDALSASNAGGVGKWNLSGDLLSLYAADGTLVKKLRVKSLRLDV